MSITINNELSQLSQWLTENLVALTASIITLIIVLAVYRIIHSQINRIKSSGRIDANTHFILNRLLRWALYIVVAAIVINGLGLRVDFLLGLWVLAGGTIIGFASMNTIGNAIAGLIIMLSQPFKISDRLYFRDQYVVVERVDLIYTRMRTQDSIHISVPNQTILNSIIEDLSVYEVIRRRCSVTIDYNIKPQKIEDILLNSISNSPDILKEPSPYVYITELQNFAMEYTLFYYITDVIRIQKIDSDVRFKVTTSLSEAGIDLNTPNLIKSLTG
jgi:small conductance mechanosensitive channel